MCTSEFVQILLQSARDPVGQLAGFLLTEDPTYLPVGPARALSRQICRDELLEEMIEVYINQTNNCADGTQRLGKGETGV